MANQFPQMHSDRPTEQEKTTVRKILVVYGTCNIIWETLRCIVMLKPMKMYIENRRVGSQANGSSCIVTTDGKRIVTEMRLYFSATINMNSIVFYLLWLV
jgi:hypothetical protein